MSKSTKYQKVLEIFKPDEVTGISPWRTRQQIEDGGMKFTGNGETRQGCFKGVQQFLWEFKRHNGKSTGKLEEIRTVGFNTEKTDTRPIGKKIRDFYRNSCCVVCGTQEIIIDHKNDLYNDPRVLNVETQTVEDFQPLCNACNLRKRQVCKKSKELGKRHRATSIPMLKIFGVDFIEGDETLDLENPNAMVGTYWYDPVRFMEHIKKKLEKHS